MAGLLDFIKTPRSDNPNRKASLAGRSQVYNLLDNIIGFNDDRITPGEALGAGLRTDPMGLLGSVAQGVEGDLSNLMFEGGAMQRPQDVLGYAAAPMAPGAMSGRMANVMSSGGAKPKSITAYHGGTGDVANAAGGRGAWFSENKDLADEYAFGGGSVNQFSISPQRPIEFLHAEQRRPIGDLISTAVENAGDLSDETISAARGKISALQKRYGEEKRPLFEYWNKDPDIADLFRTLGYDSISVAEKSGGPQTWAALTPDIISPTPTSTSPAQEVAGLLSSRMRPDSIDFKGQSKIRTQNVFASEPTQPERSLRQQADQLIESGGFDSLASQSVPVSKVVPTQNFLGAQNMERVADATEDTGAYLLKQGDEYFVLDGHHRIAKNIAEGRDVVNAKVFEVLPPSPAQEVADLLSSGRADEVTDEMLAKFTPKDEMEIFDLYQRGATGMDLPMDYESRMGRAGDFTPALHGTGADITAVDPSFFGNGQDLLGTGFYTTTAPSRADRYVPRKKTPSIERSKEYAEGGNIMPLMVREQNPFMLDQPIGNAANEIADIYAEDPFFNVERMSSGVNIVRGADNNSVMLDPYQQRHWALQNMRKSYGPSDTSDVLSEAGYSGVSGPESSGNRVRLAYEPTDIRSRFARFDPRLSHLRNLSAGVGGMGLLGMSYPQEEQY